MLVKNVKCTNHRYTPIRDYDKRLVQVQSLGVLSDYQKEKHKREGVPKIFYRSVSPNE